MTTTSGKAINLAQLQAELETASVDCSAGLGLADDSVHTYDADGQPADFPSGSQATVAQVISDHVAMREKTDAEYAAEFQSLANSQVPADVIRRQTIRDITAGLMPREQVPM